MTREVGEQAGLVEPLSNGKFSLADVDVRHEDDGARPLATSALPTLLSGDVVGERRGSANVASLTSDRLGREASEAAAGTLAVTNAVVARNGTYPNYEVVPVEIPTSTSSAEVLEKPRPQRVKLRWYAKLAYAMPELSKLSVTMLLNVHAIAFFNSFGADISTLSFLIALARSFDVLSDPLMGYLTDSTRSRYGRRRIYMAIFAPFYAIALITLMSASSVFGVVEDEAVRNSGLVSWFGVWYTFFYLCDTGCNVPHAALGPELTDKPSERNSLFFCAGLFKMLGILIAAMMPVAVQFKLSSERGCGHADNNSWPPCELLAQGEGLRATAIFLGLWYVFAIAVVCRVVKERPASVSNQTPPLVPSLMATRRNAPFMTLLPTWVLDQLAVTLVTTMITFFFLYIVQPHMTTECNAKCTLDEAGTAWYHAQPDKDERGRSTKSTMMPGCRTPFWCGTSSWIGLSIVLLIVGAMISQPFWLLATRRIEKRTVWLLFNVLNAITSIMFVAVDEGDPVLCVFCVFINGLPLGAQFLTDSIVADVIDYDEFVTGLRSEGRFTIGQSLLPKLVSVPAATLPLTILVVLGFVPPDIHGVPQPQSPLVTTFIRVVFFGLPFACSVISSVLKLRFPLRSELMRQQIREGCALHAQGLPAVDPITNRVVQPIELLPDELAEQWRCDYFFLKQLEQLYMRGPKPLIRRMRRLQHRAALGLVGGAALCIFGLSNGWQRDKRLAWICTFSALATGLSLCTILLSSSRLRAALDLQERPVNKAFLARLISLYRGEDHVANVSGITTDHVGDALDRWRLTSAARHKAVQLPSGESMALSDLMGLLHDAIATLDLPVVEAKGDDEELVSASNAAVVKKVLGMAPSETQRAPITQQLLLTAPDSTALEEQEARNVEGVVVMELLPAACAVVNPEPFELSSQSPADEKAIAFPCASAESRPADAKEVAFGAVALLRDEESDVHAGGTLEPARG